MAKGKRQPRKRGPAPKIGDQQRAEIIAVVKTGGSLIDAAGIIGCSAQTIRNAMRANPQFLRGVRHAEKAGKLRLIKRVRTARAWQAAAWMLERKYGKEFGRKDRREITGKNGGPVEYIDVTQLTDQELETLVRISDRHSALRSGAGRVSPN